MARKATDPKLTQAAIRYKDHIAVLQRNTDPPVFVVRWSADLERWSPKSNRGPAYHALWQEDKAGILSTTDRKKLPEKIAEAVAALEAALKGKAATKTLSPAVRKAAQKAARKPTQKSIEKSVVAVEAATPASTLAPPSSLDAIELDAIESTLAPTTLQPVSSGVVPKSTSTVSMSTTVDVQLGEDGKHHATVTFATRRAFATEEEAYTWGNAIQASHTRFQATLEQRAGNGGFARHRETGT